MLAVCKWASQALNLYKQPSYCSVMNILKEREKVEMKEKSMHSSMKKCLFVLIVHVENSTVQWTWKMYHHEVFLSDGMILEQATRVQTQVYGSLQEQQRTNLRFRRVWLGSFKKRIHFRQYRSHGEGCDVDQAATNAELPLLCTFLSGFSIRDQFNWDEFRLQYKSAPTTTIGPGRIPGRKKHNERLTFVVCTNGNGSEQLPKLVTGQSRKARRFNGREDWYLGYDYHHTKKA